MKNNRDQAARQAEELEIKALGASASPALTKDEECRGFTTIDHPNPETENIEEEGEPFGANFA